MSQRLNLIAKVDALAADLAAAKRELRDSDAAYTSLRGQKTRVSADLARALEREQAMREALEEIIGRANTFASDAAARLDIAAIARAFLSAGQSENEETR